MHGVRAIIVEHGVPPTYGVRKGSRIMSRTQHILALIKKAFEKQTSEMVAHV